MDKESLKKIREYIFNMDKLDIPLEDKLEILINLDILLDPNNYYKHIKILQRYAKNEKWKSK